MWRRFGTEDNTRCPLGLPTDGPTLSTLVHFAMPFSRPSRAVRNGLASPFPSGRRRDIAYYGGGVPHKLGRRPMLLSQPPLRDLYEGPPSGGSEGPERDAAGRLVMIMCACPSLSGYP